MPAAAAKDVFVHNTLTGKREKFVPWIEKKVSLYSCGPTVYGYTHIGNARAALSADLVVRVLKLAGYEVTFARNITDIDDKIIKTAKDQNVGWDDVVKKYTDAYQKELQLFEVTARDHEPRATESVDVIIDTIQELLRKNVAYVAETPFGNDVYFRVHSFSEYGKLSKRKLEDMKAGVRIEAGESKEEPLDFALWKAAKPGEPSWKSPWGEGRPGWHIECSAMIKKLFGDSIDIHMGGIDLIFPHHENEIAQSESCHEKPLAKYWLHNGLLNIGKEKMSKSLGNIFTTEKFIELYGPELFRLICAQHHYRGPIEFSEEVILRAEGMLERLYLSLQKMELASKTFDISSLKEPELIDLAQQIEAPLYDDFNTAKGLGFLFRAIRVLNKKADPEAWGLLRSVLPLLSQIFVICRHPATEALAQMKIRKLRRLGISEKRADEIEQLIATRDLARKNKDFQKSDQLRIEMESQGIAVMDGPDGTSWTLRE